MAANSVDALFLPHTLEFEPEPHSVLREAERVLIGEGHLIVLGFAPLGLWGLRHRLQRSSFPPGLAELWSAARLSDGLRVLGFEVESVRRYLCVWPSQRLQSTAAGAALERTGDWLGRVAGGGRAVPSAPKILAGAYMLSARKRVYAPTRVLHVRRRAPRFTQALARPTASLTPSPPDSRR